MLYSNINCIILRYSQKLQLRYIHRPYVNKIIYYTLCVLFPTSSLFFENLSRYPQEMVDLGD